MEQNLTVGSVPKTLFQFSLPILGANLLQSLHNIVDMAVVVGIVMLFPAPIIAFFDPKSAVVAEGVRYLRICCAANFLPYAAMYVCDSFAIGVGAAWLAMLGSMFQSVVFRIPVSIFLSQILAMGHTGLYWAECVSPVVPAVVGLAFFLSGRPALPLQM